MTRNIEINYLNSSGYDLLYPKAIDSNTEVDAIIKEILSLPESDMLDDVLLNMVLPDNKYAVALTVKTPGGRPFNGASVSGITSYVGEALTTDENGYVLGFCDTSTPTVTVTNPFLDVSGNVVQQLNLTGKVINTAEMKAVRSGVAQITYSSGSRIIQFSPDVEEFDCSAVGGGQNGRDGSDNGRYSQGGSGGNSGQVVNQANIPNTSEKINVTVGAIGANSVVGTILTALGGGGGSGGSGAYVRGSSNITRGTNGANVNAEFLYPPTSVGGAGGGGNAIHDGFRGFGGDGGLHGGGSAPSNVGWDGEDGSVPGAGGAGGCSGTDSDGMIENGNPGSGQPGLVGFMWRYKPDLT